MIVVAHWMSIKAEQKDWRVYREAFQTALWRVDNSFICVVTTEDLKIL